MRLLQRPAVQRVAKALAARGIEDRVVELADTARTAADAARARGVPVGAIAKSLVFAGGDDIVVAVIAADRRCDVDGLAAVFGRPVRLERAPAALVKARTGFTIGGVAPVGHLQPGPVAIDAGLARFPTIYAAAGHPHCVFRTTLAELAGLTGGLVAEAIVSTAPAVD